MTIRLIGDVFCMTAFLYGWNAFATRALDGYWKLLLWAHEQDPKS